MQNQSLGHSTDRKAMTKTNVMLENVISNERQARREIAEEAMKADNRRTEYSHIAINSGPPSPRNPPEPKAPPERGEGEGESGKQGREGRERRGDSGDPPSPRHPPELMAI